MNKKVAIIGTGPAELSSAYVLAKSSIKVEFCELSESVGEMAKTVATVVGFRGRIFYDANRPDGVFAKLLDTSKLNQLGWKPRASLIYGLELTYQEFKTKK